MKKMISGFLTLAVIAGILAWFPASGNVNSAKAADREEEPKQKKENEAPRSRRSSSWRTASMRFL